MVAEYSAAEEAEWEDFLSNNNRLLALIVEKEQEVNALSTDIRDFRRTAARYVSLASKVEPLVDGKNDAKDSFLKAAEMLKTEAQLAETIQAKVNEEIKGLRFLTLNPAFFIRKAMELDPKDFRIQVEVVFTSMATVSKRKLSFNASEKPNEKKPKPDGEKPKPKPDTPPRFSSDEESDKDKTKPVSSKSVWELLGCNRIPMIGDGHCGYRAVSSVQYGSDSSHRRVRQELADFFDTHKKIFMSKDFVAVRPETAKSAATLYKDMWGWMKKDPTAKPSVRNWFSNPWDCQLTALRYNIVVGVLQSEKSSIIRIFTPFNFQKDSSTWDVTGSAIDHMTKKPRFNFLGLIFTHDNHWDVFTIGNDPGDRSRSKAKKALLAGLMGESLETGEKVEKYKFVFVPNPKDLSEPPPSS